MVRAEGKIIAASAYEHLPPTRCHAKCLPVSLKPKEVMEGSTVNLVSWLRMELNFKIQIKCTTIA